MLVVLFHRRNRRRYKFQIFWIELNLETTPFFRDGGLKRKWRRKKANAVRCVSRRIDWAIGKLEIVVNLNILVVYRFCGLLECVFRPNENAVACPFFAIAKRNRPFPFSKLVEIQYRIFENTFWMRQLLEIIAPMPKTTS